MFIITLKFSINKNQMRQHLDDHKTWIKQGFDDGIFLLAGSLLPGLGGGIMAHAIERDALEKRVEEDPFVRENVVTTEILEIEASMTDARLDFLRS